MICRERERYTVIGKSERKRDFLRDLNNGIMLGILITQKEDTR